MDILKEIMDAILPGVPEKERVDHIKYFSCPEMFQGELPEGCSFDGENLTIATDRGKCKIAYDSFAKVYINSKKKLIRTENQILSKALQDKRHLKFCTWYKACGEIDMQEAMDFMRNNMPVKKALDFDDRDDYKFYKERLDWDKTEVDLDFLDIYEFNHFINFYETVYNFL
jgi:hypothetical protein